MNEVEQAIIDSSDNLALKMRQFTFDGQVYTGYSDYSFVWEKTYAGSRTPGRANDGNMGDLNTFPTFLTPHMVVKYDIMPIKDYRIIMKHYYAQNQGKGECYDPVYDNVTNNIMYVATDNKMPTFLIKVNAENVPQIVGVKDITIELIGTNNTGNG